MSSYCRRPATTNCSPPDSRTQQHDPETARMARLAALESRGAGGGVGGGANGRREGGAAVPLLAANDPGVLALQV